MKITSSITRNFKNKQIRWYGHVTYSWLSMMVKDYAEMGVQRDTRTTAIILQMEATLRHKWKGSETRREIPWISFKEDGSFWHFLNTNSYPNEWSRSLCFWRKERKLRCCKDKMKKAKNHWNIMICFLLVRKEWRSLMSGVESCKKNAKLVSKMNMSFFNWSYI